MVATFGNIAIFVLATTLRNSIENRIVPISSTWGFQFEHLYFVMGTNQPDKDYLNDRCKLQEDPHGRSLARAPPSSQADKLFEYRCIPGNFPVNVLLTANCTGTYFGLGPTCRCEESMRFFWTASRFSTVQWFMFIDDDVYIRPLPLMTMLSGFDSTIDQSITLIRYSAVWNYLLKSVPFIRG